MRLILFMFLTMQAFLIAEERYRLDRSTLSVSETGPVTLLQTAFSRYRTITVYKNCIKEQLICQASHWERICEQNPYPYPGPGYPCGPYGCGPVVCRDVQVCDYYAREYIRVSRAFGIMFNVNTNLSGQNVREYLLSCGPVQSETPRLSTLDPAIGIRYSRLKANTFVVAK